MKSPFNSDLSRRFVVFAGEFLAAGNCLRPVLTTPALFLALFGISPVVSARTTSVIQGIVVDAQGLSIANAEVTVSGSSGATAIKLITDQTGSYRLSGVQSGVYSLRVTKPGFGTKLYERIPVTV